MRLMRFHQTLALASVAGLLVLSPCPAFAQAPVPQPAPPAPPASPVPPGVFVAGPGSYIGVSIRDVDAAESERLKTQGGALVDEVRHDSPAEKAGVKAGDVIMEFDGERVRSARTLTRLVEDTPAGRTVKATVLRDGRKTDLSITPSADQHAEFPFNGGQLRVLADRFPNDFAFDFDIDGFSPRARLGVSVQELPEQLAQYFGTQTGVLVASVNADSPAARAGLKAGDVITKVGTTAVRSRGDLVRALHDVGDDGNAPLEVVRDKRTTMLTAKLEGPRRPARSNRVRPA